MKNLEPTHKIIILLAMAASVIVIIGNVGVSLCLMDSRFCM